MGCKLNEFNLNQIPIEQHYNNRKVPLKEDPVQLWPFVSDRDQQPVSLQSKLPCYCVRGEITFPVIARQTSWVTVFVSAWTLVSLWPLVPLLCSPLAPSLSAPASCSPPRPSRAYNDHQPGLHANFAAASPPSPAAPLTRCVWRLNRHGGPAKAEFGNTRTGKDEKPACFTSAVCYVCCDGRYSTILLGLFTWRHFL